MADGVAVSSTRIRHLLGMGNVAEAAALLGRPHRVEGVVARGEGRGRALEAPTANLWPVEGMALPRAGIYVTRSTVDGRESHPSVTSIGTNPTFETDGRLRIETLLLDFTGDLYGRHLAVDFIEHVRAQKAFPDTAALAAQIRLDVQTALEVHGLRTIDKEELSGENRTRS
jgi:riboflavin kinase/FMN adenylyltransferase